MLNDRSRLAGVQYSIGQDLRGPAADPNRALRTARDFWRIDENVSIWASKSLPWAGDTACRSGACVVKVGPTGMDTTATLLATVYHEGIHVAQYPANWGAPETDAAAVNEVEAYDKELLVSRRLGLPADRVEQLNGFRSQWYDSIQSKSYRLGVDPGNYRLSPGDSSPP